VTVERQETENTAMRRALVFGGTGAIGREVLRELAQRDVEATFTYLRAERLARELEQSLGHTAERVDLRRTSEIVELIRSSCESPPDLFIHCAGVGGQRALSESSDEHWEEVFAVNCRSAFVACRELAPLFGHRGGDVVLVAALDRSVAAPVPVAFAASQGALSTMTMALAKELGPFDVRVNQICAGLLDSGLSSDFAAALRDDFERFSALRRLGTPAEIARAVVWLALENRYISGKGIPVDGGM